MKIGGISLYNLHIMDFWTYLFEVRILEIWLIKSEKMFESEPYKIMLNTFRTLTSIGAFPVMKNLTDLKKSNGILYSPRPFLAAIAAIIKRDTEKQKKPVNSN